MSKETNFAFIRTVSSIVRNFGFCQDVADFIACQFALESNFGNSSLALKYHNYCGMKFPLVRISVARRISKSNSFARYNDIVQCVFDYMLCLNYHQPMFQIKDSVSSFIVFIEKWYCPEKSYIDKINSIYVQFKSYKNGK